MFNYSLKEENAVNCFAVMLAEAFPLPEEEQEKESAFFFAINDPSQKANEYDWQVGLNVLTHTETMQSTMRTVYKIIEAICAERNCNPYNLMEELLKSQEENSDDDK